MGKILQLRVQLAEIKPAIWREFIVSDFWTFEKLHKIIQKVMGWENYHLYEFNVNGVKIGLKDEDVDYELKNSKVEQIWKYIDEEKQKFHYLYDFGDSWEHEITVKKINEDNPENRVCPSCISGERACPLEDCGGTSGYERIVEVLKNKEKFSDEDSKELLEWAGDWEPERIDVDEINRELKKHAGFG